MAVATPVTDPVATLRPSHEFPSVFRFFDEYAHHLANHEVHLHNSAPRFDLEQHVSSYEIFGELPGANIQDITVEAIDEHHLQISGKILRPGTQAGSDGSAGQPGTDNEFVKVAYHTVPKPTAAAPEEAAEASTEHKEDAAAAPVPETTTQKVRHLISERRYGEFTRLFRFATQIKPDQVVARLHNGILHVTVPSVPRKPGRHVKIDWAPEAYGPFMM